MVSKIGINGYGTIGKRVADAIKLQDDMELVGVTKNTPNFEAKLAEKKNYDLYSSTKKRYDKFVEKGYKVEGTLDDLIDKVDLIVDCTPAGIGKRNKKKYEENDVKAIFQGGESHELTDFSFNSSINYEKALGRDYIRVVSCNTTALCRTISRLKNNFQIGKIRATMIRRGGDPDQDDRGPLNAIKPKLEVPSHHGPDVQSVDSEIDIETTAVKVPTTIMHMHSLNVEVSKDITKEKIVSTLRKDPRILLIEKDTGIDSTSKLVELARDEGRKRYDIWEIPIWVKSIEVTEGGIYLFQAVHQESDVVPENIDGIRAMLELENSRGKSKQKTNETLGIGELL
ncbi:MAG: Glyceraldehyde-3-phosphate dehydrogenase GapA [Candidatus Methanohalarchaeum thermophilum]|uniref:Glyceraldehyde-3-phosphate dehydrogenase n=1 Tax=Methanohalarchaeum thermophilum TaxID=1903181 RepID=A0A1Q6DXF9_METT1|nr:MAG: Glyceraldehyde-3-phosphate dehydrogenase GapA [Candidatus Methanohalarchaeum thermophilum]